MTDASPNTATAEPNDGVITPTTAPDATSQTTAATPDLPDWAKDPVAAAKMVADLRAENARDRTSAKEKAAEEARSELLEKLGLKKTEEQVDPDQLARDLAAKDATIRDLQVRSALSDALASSGAKPLARAAILGDGLLNDLDPASADFASTVASRVAEYVNKNPELKAVQAASKSGVDIPGGSATQRTFTRAQLRDHAFYQANKAEIERAAAEGRIV